MQKFDWKSFVLPGALAFAAGLVAWLQTSLSTMFTAEVMLGQWPVYAPLAALTAMCVTLVFLALLGRWSRATAASGVFFTVLSIVNYYVYDLHGTPLVPQDILNFATAANVIGSYQLFLSKRVVLIAALLLPVLALVWLQRRLEKPIPLPRRLAGCAGGIFVILYAGYFSPWPVKPMSNELCDRRHVYNEYSYLPCTVEAFQIFLRPIMQPTGYSDGAAAEAAARAECYTPAVATVDAQDYPDIVLILSESFYDLSLVTDLQTDIDPLAVTAGLSNTITGYTVSPACGGGTNQSEYEMLTSNSLTLMPGVTPFNSLSLGSANSLCRYLQSLGYTTMAAHPAPAYNYRRGISWVELGFDAQYFLPQFPTEEYYGERTDYRTDHALFRDFTAMYEEMPADQPRFSFLITIQTHGSYDLNPPELDTVHAAADYGSYDDDVDEYLSCLALSDQAFGELCNYFTRVYEQTGRRVIVAMAGDHAPSFVSAVADPSRADGDALTLLERCTPFLIWANYPLENAGAAVSAADPLNRMDMCLLAPTVVEQAGLPLSPYYRYLLAMRDTAPAFTNLTNYMAADGTLQVFGGDALADEWVTGYYALEYNNVGSGAHRDDSYFLPSLP